MHKDCLRAPSAATNCAIVLACLMAAAAWAQSADKEYWYVDAVRMPADLGKPFGNRPVIIAVVDDGIRLSHEAVRDFIWSNPDEIPGNNIDDDGNGFVDDVYGWDVSDGDGSVAPPDYREDFQHGTHVASIIGRIARRVYGDDASQYIRILPVKAISDDSRDTYLKDGFRGVEYAMQAEPDIILAAWSVAHISQQEEAILERAADAGILIVGAGGNWAQEQEMYPAAHPDVLAVGSVERNGEKTIKSNYGQFIDILAPGTGVRGASVESDDSYQELDGTSFSAAIVAATAAIVKLQNGVDAPSEIKACLLNSADLILVDRKEFHGKLGAGQLNAAKAIRCELLKAETSSDQRTINSKGFLRASQRRATTLSWTIDPGLEIEGFVFRQARDREQTVPGVLEFRGETGADLGIVHRYNTDTLPNEIYIPGTAAHITFTPKQRRSVDWLMAYEAKAIKFADLYCSGRSELTTEGVLSDGSKSESYSANSHCQWLITAPPGKVIEFTFDEMHIEPNVDKLYFFDGPGTNAQIMAVMSGGELPPVFVTWRNQVLVWFVTDGQTQGDGWTTRYRFVDRPQ